MATTRIKKKQSAEPRDKYVLASRIALIVINPLNRLQRTALMVCESKKKRDDNRAGKKLHFGGP